MEVEWSSWGNAGGEALQFIQQLSFGCLRETSLCHDTHHDLKQTQVEFTTENRGAFSLAALPLCLLLPCLPHLQLILQIIHLFSVVNLPNAVFLFCSLPSSSFSFFRCWDHHCFSPSSIKKNNNKTINIGSDHPSLWLPSCFSIIVCPSVSPLDRAIFLHTYSPSLSALSVTPLFSLSEEESCNLPLAYVKLMS